MPSALLEIFVDSIRLAEQKGNVLPGRFQKARENLDRLGKVRLELVVFLIAPGIAEGGKLPLQDRELSAHLGIEVLQMLGKTPQFGGIDKCPRHETLLLVIPLDVLMIVYQRESPR
jgi:hypothetical protein